MNGMSLDDILFSISIPKHEPFNPQGVLVVLKATDVPMYGRPVIPPGSRRYTLTYEPTTGYRSDTGYLVRSVYADGTPRYELMSRRGMHPFGFAHKRIVTITEAFGEHRPIYRKPPENVRTYRIGFEVTDRDGNDLIASAQYTFNRDYGIQQEREWLTGQYTKNTAKVLVEKNLLFGSTIGELQVDLIGTSLATEPGDTIAARLESEDMPVNVVAFRRKA